MMVDLTSVVLSLAYLGTVNSYPCKVSENAAEVGLQERLYQLYRWERRAEETQQFTCGLCETTLSTIVNAYPHNVTAAVQAASYLCKNMNILTDKVCKGMLNVYMGMFKYMATHMPNGTMPHKVCTLLVSKGDCVFEDEWTVDVDLGTKPATTVPQLQESETLTIVQLTDIHYETEYLVGSNAVCGEPMCCLRSQGLAANQSLSAGTWGDYRGCDVPLNTLENTLQFIKKQHQKIDYVYMTGDLVDHGGWVVSQEFNSKVITKVVNLLAQTFGDTPIIYALGNHEAVPASCYAPSDVDDESLSAKWLFKLVSKLWSPYITDEAKQTILKGGYYTLKIRDGFRVIVLNNNVCYRTNYWLAYESEDPYNQLKWLAETLLQAEKGNEKVHLIYHIPSGIILCAKTWSREFNKIVNRFENTITAQFNGHTHKDGFRVFYPTDNTFRVSNVALIGGSVTTFVNVNTNYKVYTVDPHSWYVLDAESWIFNLTDANLQLNSTPNWFRQYSFRDAFGVKSLIPSEIESLVNRMTKDHSLLQKYNSFHFKDADPSMAEGCDDDCLKTRLCEIVTADSSDSVHCSLAKADFDAAKVASTMQ